MRKGRIGTEQLNTQLQQLLNPGPDGAKASRDETALEKKFRPGDRVMQLRNDYDKDVFNGDLGEIRKVQGGSVFVTIDGRDVQYKVPELDALTLAYASTIHKVQGSEFDAVVLILDTSHHMLLTRALLYTAVTRAKKLVVIVGDPRALDRAVRNVRSTETHCALASRIRQSAAGGDPRSIVDNPVNAAESSVIPSNDDI